MINKEELKYNSHTPESLKYKEGSIIKMIGGKLKKTKVGYFRWEFPEPFAVFNRPTFREFDFINDYNQMMKIVDFIENINRIHIFDSFDVIIDKKRIWIKGGRDIFVTFGDDYIKQAITIIRHFRTKEEALFEAIYLFSVEFNEKS
jgi:hypothetical protein